MKRLLASALFLLCSTSAFAADAAIPDPRKPETFEIDGNTAYLYAAPNPAPGKPWVFHMPTFKGMSFAYRKAYFEGFMNAGISLAGINLGEARGSEISTAKFKVFYDEMVKRGYSPKPIITGQSRGGLMMLGWAMRHPDLTSGLVGIYPCCNLLTWGMKNVPAVTADYGMTKEEMMAKMKELNPVDNLDVMIKAKIPIFVVQGDADKAVPIKDNTLLLKERYQAGGGDITVKMIPGHGHEIIPEYFECQELLDFIIAKTGGRPQPPIVPSMKAAATKGATTAPAE